jgi:hypothetical protein
MAGQLPTVRARAGTAVPAQPAVLAKSLRNPNEPQNGTDRCDSIHTCIASGKEEGRARRCMRLGVDDLSTDKAAQHVSSRTGGEQRMHAAFDSEAATRTGRRRAAPPWHSARAGGPLWLRRARCCHLKPLFPWTDLDDAGGRPRRAERSREQGAASSCCGALRAGRMPDATTTSSPSVRSARASARTGRPCACICMRV